MASPGVRASLKVPVSRQRGILRGAGAQEVDFSSAFDICRAHQLAHAFGHAPAG
jgi:hypothetical protein